MLFGLITKAPKNSTYPGDDFDRPSCPTPPPPQLRLNGEPISAPALTSSPRSRSKMVRTSQQSDVRQRKSYAGSDATSDASADTLKPVPYTARSKTSKPAQVQQRRVKSSPRRPSPFTQPISYFRFLIWRTNIYFRATFSLGMLADWEIWLVATIAIISALVLLYSLFFQFPKHFQTVMKRAAYYVYGAGSNALTQQQHQAAAGHSGSFPVVYPDGAGAVGEL